MKKKRNLKLFIMTLLCSLLLGNTAFAYNQEDYVYGERGWEVDHFHGESVKVILYEFCQPSIKIDTMKDWYVFEGTDAVFEYGFDEYAETRSHGILAFPYSGMNSQVIDTIGDSPIWVWEFSIQPGTYVFATDNWGNGDFCYKCTLTQDLQIPLRESENNNIYEEISLIEGDELHLYVLNGEYQWGADKLKADTWITENAKDFQNWAYENEMKYKKQYQMTDTGEKEVISVDMGDVFESDPVIITATPAPTISPVEETAEVVEKKPMPFGVWIGGIAFVILGILGFIVGKKK